MVCRAQLDYKIFLVNIYLTVTGVTSTTTTTM